MTVRDVSPTLNKSVLTPNPSVPRISLTISKSFSSISVLGLMNSSASISGSGRFLKSVFPLGVFGNSSNCVKYEGTIYSGIESIRCCFKSSIFISPAAVK